MTRVSEIPMHCPDCGAEGSATIYKSVDVSLDDTLKERLLSGKIFRWRCESCSEQANLLAFPLLYHDMNEAIVIHLIPRESVLDKETLEALKLPETWASRRLNSDYRFRIVRDAVELIDKIRVFEAGLDDRAIEWLKKAFWVRVEDAGIVAGASDQFTMSVRPRFIRAVDGDNASVLEFVGPIVLRRPGQEALPSIQLIQVPIAIYQRAARHLGEYLPWPEPLCGDFMCIDNLFLDEVWNTLPDIGMDAICSPDVELAIDLRQADRDWQQVESKPWWKFW